MDEFYSRALSPEARSALVDFIEAYVLTLRGQKADATAERAKALAAAVLATDIDILVFTLVIRNIYASQEMLTYAVMAAIPPREFAGLVVDITETARSIDIQRKTS